MKFLVLTFCLFSCLCFSQEEDAWVYLKDKPSSNIYLNSPLFMLSQHSLDRRTAQGISLDLKDVPVESSYVNTISQSNGITVLAKSKWLNALHVRGTIADINLVAALSIVDSVQFKDNSLNKGVGKKASDKFSIEKALEAQLNYGQTENQTTMLSGDFLHDLGYLGTGCKIAILDAGFKGVETFTAFDRLHDANLSNGEILGGYDYVNRNSDYYGDTGNTHGLSVLSTIGAYIDHQFIGTAPNAEFYLYVTEDVASETPLEESLWVEAAEAADSIGVDIINTSLGYTTYDDSNYSYSYSDMDGATTFISRGAEIASSRGMLLVTSAGNEGSSSWKYISAPADTPSVLSVGAVDANEIIASFSSFGPTADNRVKPEVLAQGRNVYVINSAGNISLSNGTSFSGPIMAGMSACLWQAFPNKTASEIKDLIVQSADRFHNSDDQYGYGIPDFQSIYESLDVEHHKKQIINIYPNPVTDKLHIILAKNYDYKEVHIFNVLGQLIAVKNISSSENIIDMEGLDSGVYVLELVLGTNSHSVKVLKK